MTLPLGDNGRPGGGGIALPVGDNGRSAGAPSGRSVAGRRASVGVAGCSGGRPSAAGRPLEITREDASAASAGAGAGASATAGAGAGSAGAGATAAGSTGVGSGETTGWAGATGSAEATAGVGVTSAAGASTATARLLQLEEPLLNAHLPRATAGITGDRRRPLGSAAAMAGLAFHEARDLDLGGVAKNRLRQLELELVTQIGPAKHLIAATSSATRSTS